MKMKHISAIILSTILIPSIVGCATTQSDNNVETPVIQTTTTEVVASETTITTTQNTSEDSSSNIISSVEGSMLDLTEMFSSRDLEQSADLTESVVIKLISGEDVAINEEGVYVLSGEVEDVTVLVDAEDDAKVQIVLDGVSIINENSPAIVVKNADKVFVTTTDSDNYMEVSGTFLADGDTHLDAVIYSTADLTVNGLGTLEIISKKGNGVASKDDLKITGGTYLITSDADALEANDSILIYDGVITIVTNKDGLHSENEDDAALGLIYMQNGTLNITAADDAIHGNSIVQIDGGVINVETCTEGIEGTYIQINGGVINIYATDDGINATSKSNYDVVIEVNGGTIYVSMGGGDTDAFDANGNIYINGGIIEVEAQSAFDSDGTAELNGGEVTVNGSVITQIIQRQMGGGGKRR